MPTPELGDPVSLLVPSDRQWPLQLLQHHPLICPSAEDRLDEIRREQRQPQDAARVALRDPPHLGDVGHRAVDAAVEQALPSTPASQRATTALLWSASSPVAKWVLTKPVSPSRSASASPRAAACPRAGSRSLARARILARSMALRRPRRQPIRKDRAERARLEWHGGVPRRPLARLHVDGTSLSPARQAMPDGPAQ